MRASERAGRAQWAVVILILCILIVGFWEVMSERARRPWDAFGITARDFREFAPASEQWSFKPIEVSFDPLEPNIVAYEAREKAASAAPVLIRLAHGYNMPDCMRIKHYRIELLHDARHGVAALPRTQQPTPNNQHPITNNHPLPHQLWRLLSPAGDISVWASTMLNAGDFRATDVDTRSMAFPRIGIAEDPRWLPRGMTLKSFRHPVRNLRWMLRAAWNNSRCDLLTFLKLRQPAYMSDEMLTLVSAAVVPEGRPEHFGQAGMTPGEQAAADSVLAVHGEVYAQLRAGRLGRIAESGVEPDS